MGAASDNLQSFQRANHTHSAGLSSLRNVASTGLNIAHPVSIIDHLYFPLAETQETVCEVPTPMARFGPVQRWLVGKIYRMDKRGPYISEDAIIRKLLY